MIGVLLKDGWHYVPCIRTDVEGLVVTLVDGEWTITHQESGKRVGYTYPSHTDAQEAAKHLEHLAEWTLPEEDLWLLGDEWCAQVWDALEKERAS